MERGLMSKFLRSMINVFRSDAPNKKETVEKEQLKTVQMPSPWSKVEKYKRIKKDNYF